MAVVTHGSFDEGPLVLGDGLGEIIGTVETDPVFTAWNKSTGITISKSQITDSIITGSNTGDQNLTGLVPYTGATDNVNLGSNTLNVERAYANQETPVSSTELATKGYADSLAFTGAGGITPTVAHNDTTGKEGGGGGFFYHLSDTVNAVIPNITTSGSDIVPTGLALNGSGISDGLDGLSYIILTWDAIVSDTFDHYQIEYKKTTYAYYTPLSSTTNTIIIEGLTPNTSYNFRVASVNRYGTSSVFSDDLILTTPIDSVAPATVSGVITTGGIQYVIIEWTSNTDVDLDSYNVYMNTANDSATSTKISNCKTNYFIDGGKTGGTPYYYWIKAIDTSGNESTAWSTYATATPRNVTNTDIVTIAGSKVLIDGAVYLSNWQKSTDLTKIDGGAISANTITTTQLNFTPIQGSNVIATINASSEGIQIDADNFAVSGATIFTSKVGGSFTSSNSVPRIRIFPDSNIGIEVVDNLGNNVFKAEIGGTNLGDVTIGNWIGNQGIKYDKSAGTTSFAGTIAASSGTISGLLSFGTTPSSSGYNIAIATNDIWENNYPGDDSILNINRLSYNGGILKRRYTDIYDGKNNLLCRFNPYTFSVDMYGKATVVDILTLNKGTGTCLAVLTASVVIGGSTANTYSALDIQTAKALIFPRMTTVVRNNNILSPTEGMVIYNTTTHRINMWNGSNWMYFDEYGND